MDPRSVAEFDGLVERLAARPCVTADLVLTQVKAWPFAVQGTWVYGR